MNYYLRLVLNLLFIVFSLVFVGPKLISAKDDILFLAGIVYLVFVVPAVVYYANRNFVIKTWRKLNEVD